MLSVTCAVTQPPPPAPPRPCAVTQPPRPALHTCCNSAAPTPRPYAVTRPPHAPPHTRAVTQPQAPSRPRAVTQPHAPPSFAPAHIITPSPGSPRTLVLSLSRVLSQQKASLPPPDTRPAARRRPMDAALLLALGLLAQVRHGRCAGVSGPCTERRRLRVGRPGLGDREPRVLCGASLSRGECNRLRWTGRGAKFGDGQESTQKASPHSGGAPLSPAGVWECSVSREARERGRQEHPQLGKPGGLVPRDPCELVGDSPWSSWVESEPPCVRPAGAAAGSALQKPPLPGEPWSPWWEQDGRQETQAAPLATRAPLGGWDRILSAPGFWAGARLGPGVQRVASVVSGLRGTGLSGGHW